MTANTYQSIRDAIYKRIVAGDWPAGTNLPGEAELAQEYGCARTTVNRAIQSLAREGLVERKRKSGTRVKELRSRRASFEIQLIRHQVENTGGAYGYHLLSLTSQVSPSSISAKLRLTDKRSVMHIEALHLKDNSPFAFEDRWVNVQAAPGIEDAPLERVSANEWLVREIPYTNGVVSLSAAAAQEREAEALNVNVGAALFLLDRTTWDDQQTITTVTIFHRPEFRLKIEI